MSARSDPACSTYDFRSILHPFPAHTLQLLGLTLTIPVVECPDIPSCREIP